MEAMHSMFGFGVSCKTNMINTSPNPPVVRSALRSEAFIYVPHAKRAFCEACSDSELVLQVAEKSMRALECRASVPRRVAFAVTEGGSESVTQRKKLAVFVSGGGSNFQAIHEGTVDGLVHGDVVVLVTNKPGCGGAEYARDNGIPVVLFPKSKFSSERLSPIDLVTTLRGFEVDFILLAGFLKLIPVELVEAYPRSILNIHPSLLPAFGGKGYYGLKVHEAVISSGARYSGPTVHFVDEHFDTGRILAQRVVPVAVNDTAEQLAARVLHEEHQVYVEVVSALCEERIVWREDGVPLIRSKQNPDELG